MFPLWTPHTKWIISRLNVWHCEHLNENYFHRHQNNNCNHHVSSTTNHLRRTFICFGLLECILQTLHVLLVPGSPDVESSSAFSSIVFLHSIGKGTWELIFLQIAVGEVSDFHPVGREWMLCRLRGVFYNNFFLSTKINLLFHIIWFVLYHWGFLES